MAMPSVQKDHPTVSSAAHSMPVAHAGRCIQGFGDPRHPVHQRGLLHPSIGNNRCARSLCPSRRVL